MAISGKPPSEYTPFGSASVTTTIQPVWTPASGKTLTLEGFDIRAMSGEIQVDFTDGTAAASGTILTYPLSDAWLNVGGISKQLSAVDQILGIKARAGAGSVSGTFYGREK